MLLGKSQRRVQQMVKEGLLPGSIRLGKRILHIPAAAVFAALQTSEPARPVDSSAPTPGTDDEGNDV